MCRESARTITRQNVRKKGTLSKRSLHVLLTGDVDKLVKEVEGKAGSQMAQLISKSNALRRACKDKQTEFKMLEEEIIAAEGEELRHF